MLRDAAVEVLEVGVVLLEPLPDRLEQPDRAGEDEDLVAVGPPLVEQVVEDGPLAAERPAESADHSAVPTHLSRNEEKP